MNKKMCIIAIICFVIIIFIHEKSYAKYIVNEILQMEIYIDKTSPIIYLESENINDVFSETDTNLIKLSNYIKISTTDNVEIKSNQYFYNSKECDFENKEPTQFFDNEIFLEDGYYKFVAIDSSNNKTEIVILIDKSEPDIKINYYKKGEKTAEIRSVSAKIKNLTSSLENNEIVKNVDEEIDDNRNESNEEKLESEEKENEENQFQESEHQPENTIDLVEKIENCIDNENIDKTQITNEEVGNQIVNYFKEEGESESEIEVEKINDLYTDVQISNIQNQVTTLAITDAYVGNETEFRNALTSQASVIHVRQSIDFASSISINYPVRIVAESADNALRYGNGGNFITVKNGGALTIDSMVIDTNSSGASNMCAINIESDGYVKFINSSIVDAGLGNIGILVNGGATLQLYSCEIVRGKYGIKLIENANLLFETQENRGNNFWWNSAAVFIDNFYGSVNFDKNICMHDNTDYGIYISNCTGKINILSGSYYNNTYCVRTCKITGESVKVSGGDFHNNGWSFWVGGSLTLSGGSVYSNHHAVLTDGTFDGSFIMTGGKIYSNANHAIQHQKYNDKGCIILGGTINGEVYLANNDNYINTNSSYPSFTVKPSTYYLKRKLIKTDSNSYATAEREKITVILQDNWYTYVEPNSEFIVLWNGGNVKIKCIDYYGNVLREEVLNGTIGTNYSVKVPEIENYEYVSLPSNMIGMYTKDDINIEIKYDLVNVAEVNYDDLLSGIEFAKYWYSEDSNFIGEGIDFEDGTIFEKYGYYKIVVKNGTGLKKEVEFELNKKSVSR